MAALKKCFVCEVSILQKTYELNKEVNLPVCPNCKGTSNEKKMVEEMLDSLADGLVCGCI